MTNLETKDFKLIPLDERNLKLYINDISLLEEELSLNTSGHVLVEPLRIALRTTLDNVILNRDKYLLATIWLIILKSENVIIGSVGFKNIPDKDGNIEIGYGTRENYRCKGYMTLAVKELCRWALSQEYVNRVIAETEKDNIPSSRVLEKAGMKIFRETEKELWWGMK